MALPGAVGKLAFFVLNGARSVLEPGAVRASGSPTRLSRGHALTKTRWHALILMGVLAAAAQSAQGQMLWFELMDVHPDLARDVQVEECPPAIRRTIRQQFKNEKVVRIVLEAPQKRVFADGSSAEFLGGCMVLVEADGLRYVHAIDHTGAITDKGLAPVKEAAFKLGDAPAPIQEAVRREADGADVTDGDVKMGVFRGAKSERAVFCVVVKLDGEEWLMVLDADGTVLDASWIGDGIDADAVPR